MGRVPRTRSHVEEADVPGVAGDERPAGLLVLVHQHAEQLVRGCFHAEDGIRDATGTGVQTCALPIFSGPLTNLANRHVSSAGMRHFPFFNGSAHFSQSGSRSWNEKLSGTRSTIHGLEKAWNAPSRTALPSPRK